MLEAGFLLDVPRFFRVPAALSRVLVYDALSLALIAAQGSCQICADNEHLLADLLGLIERPLVVLFSAVDDCLGVGTMRTNGDNGQNDADHADQDTHCLPEGVSRVVVMPGMDFDLCHQS